MASTRRNASIRLVEREAKAERNAVAQEIKNLELFSSHLKQAQKSARKADLTLEKRDKYEHKAAKAMNQAIQEHDIAVAKLEAARKDAKLRHDHRLKLTKAVEVRKAAVETAIQNQEEHDKRRESKLAQIRGVPVSQGTNPVIPKVQAENTGLPGQSGPAVDSRAAGYGVDFNHTAVDSEGNAQGTTNYNGGPATSHNIDGHGYN